MSDTDIPQATFRPASLNHARYQPDAATPTAAILIVFGAGIMFALLDARRHEHRTPWGVTQPFVYARFRREPDVAPILNGKDACAPAVFAPLTVLREARRQRQLPGLRVPPVCLLDPDGDIVRWL